MRSLADYPVTMLWTSLLLLLALPVRGDELLPQPAGEERVATSRAAGIAGHFVLEVEHSRVDATYLTETLGKSRGAILILHDAGGGLDSRGVVAALRHALPGSGWSVMTVALDYVHDAAVDAAPTAPAEGAETATSGSVTDDDAAPGASDAAPAGRALPPANAGRIGAAIAHLRAKTGAQPLIVIGHGRGAEQALALLDLHDELDGLVLITAPADSAALLSLPASVAVLDVVADGVLLQQPGAVERRAEMRRAQRALYSQRHLPSSQPALTGFERPLVSIVRAWLQRHFVDTAG